MIYKFLLIRPYSREHKRIINAAYYNGLMEIEGKAVSWKDSVTYNDRYEFVKKYL